MVATNLTPESGQSRRPWASVLGAGVGVGVVALGGAVLGPVVGGAVVFGVVVFGVGGVVGAAVDLAAVLTTVVVPVVRDTRPPAVVVTAEVDADPVALVAVVFVVPATVDFERADTVDPGAADFVVPAAVVEDVPGETPADVAGAAGAVPDETTPAAGAGPPEGTTLLEASTPVRVGVGDPLTNPAWPTVLPADPLDLPATKKITPRRTAIATTMKPTRRTQ